MWNIKEKSLTEGVWISNGLPHCAIQSEILTPSVMAWSKYYKEGKVAKYLPAAVICCV